MKGTTFVFLLAIASAACTSVGGNSGQQFLAAKTGIELRDPPSVCGTDVDNYEDCRPHNFGPGHWERTNAFPPYTVKDADDSVDEMIGEVRAHYLGTPFYAGDIHAFCKPKIDDDDIPAEGTTLQEYNLAKILEDRAVRASTAEVKDALDAKSVDGAARISDQVKSNLTREVRNKVKARVIWFVTRYPGGAADIERNKSLRRCVEEAKANPNAKVVTGIAGYLIVQNKVDLAVGRQSTLLNALDEALESGRHKWYWPFGEGDEVNLDSATKHRLAEGWAMNVERVAGIRTARNDLTSTAYPLWVQLQ